MKPISPNEKERIKKMNEAALYDIGYHHSERICRETDVLLEEYKDLEYPESLDTWFDDFLKNRKKELEKNRRVQKLGTYSKRAAVVVLAVIITAATVTVSVEAYRIQFLNFIIETKEKYSLVNIEEDTGATIDFNQLPTDWMNFYYPTYIPRGYIFKQASGDEVQKRMVFEDFDYHEITFIQAELSASMQLDTEDGDVIQLEINGNRGMLIEENGYVIINWYNQEKLFTLDGEIDQNILIQMAKSIEKNNF
ncbi:MAG: hypothetical protein CVV02_07410 [Firmicutes bacterium HGW-Firmicutes-7]|nr:MAG: hypothetical protein CVV02_07410 [Firmicutes bacterium HGW-Firmicutes-7]